VAGGRGAPAIGPANPTNPRTRWSPPRRVTSLGAAVMVSMVKVSETSQGRAAEDVGAEALDRRAGRLGKGRAVAARSAATGPKSNAVATSPCGAFAEAGRHAHSKEPGAEHPPEVEAHGRQRVDERAEPRLVGGVVDEGADVD